jgi:hypothetical protein
MKAPGIPGAFFVPYDGDHVLPHRERKCEKYDLGKKIT